MAILSKRNVLLATVFSAALYGVMSPSADDSADLAFSSDDVEEVVEMADIIEGLTPTEIDRINENPSLLAAAHHMATHPTGDRAGLPNKAWSVGEGHPVGVGSMERGAAQQLAGAGFGTPKR